MWSDGAWIYRQEYKEDFKKDTKELWSAFYVIKSKPKEGQIKLMVKIWQQRF